MRRGIWDQSACALPTAKEHPLKMIPLQIKINLRPMYLNLLSRAMLTKSTCSFSVLTAGLHVLDFKMM